MLSATSGEITIAGFSDENGDGIRNGADPERTFELSGSYVYRDDGDGAFDPEVDERIEPHQRVRESSFQRLQFGHYFAVAPDTRFETEHSPVRSGPHVTEIDISAESPTASVEVGYQSTGSLTFSIFHDLNANAIRDPDEGLYLPEFLIEIENLSDETDQLLEIVNGESDPVYFQAGTDVEYIANTLFNRVVATTIDSELVPIEAGVNRHFEIGVVQGGSVRLTTFSDETGDGRSEDDQPISSFSSGDGIRIKVTGELPSGQTTESLGGYLFPTNVVSSSRVRPGNYRVEIVPANDDIQLYSQEPLVHEFVVTPGDLHEFSFPIFVGEAIEDELQASLFQNESFSAHVELFRDDGDRLFDPKRDMLLDGVLVEGDPEFKLDHPGPGDFFLATRVGAEYTQGEIDRTYLQTAQSRRTNLTTDVALSTITGRIYADANFNGIYEPRERGLWGVQLTVEGTDIYGNTFTKTAKSGLQGTFYISDILPGTYSLNQEQPAGYADGFTTAGNLGGIPALNRIDNIVIEDFGAPAEDYLFAEYGEPNTRQPQKGFEVEVGAFDPQTGFSYLQNNFSAREAWAAYQFGPPSSQPVVGDWDMDGDEAVGVFESQTGLFRLKNRNRNDITDPVDELTPFLFGGPGFIAIAGDWNYDGVDSVGVYDPATSNFYLRNSNDSGIADAGQFTFGRPGWIPIAGDWNGDGFSGIGVYDPETATFYLRNSLSAGSPEGEAFNYGMPHWKPIAGDWNDDGLETVGVYNPDTATYFLRNSNSTGEADINPFNYGLAGWEPIVGRWNTDYAARTKTPSLAGVGVTLISTDAGHRTYDYADSLKDYLNHGTSQQAVAQPSAKSSGSVRESLPIAPALEQARQEVDRVLDDELSDDLLQTLAHDQLS